MAMAIKAFKANEVSRIVLVRPAVEAGERLGFLPGDLKDKVDPYLRPLYDALYDILGAENCERHMARGAIEIAPLAYMRGRTPVSYTHLDVYKRQAQPLCLVTNSKMRTLNRLPVKAGGRWG